MSITILTNMIFDKMEEIEAIDPDEKYLHDYENWYEALDWVVTQIAIIKAKEVKA